MLRGFMLSLGTALCRKLSKSVCKWLTGMGGTHVAQDDVLPIKIWPRRWHSLRLSTL